MSEYKLSFRPNLLATNKIPTERYPSHILYADSPSTATSATNSSSASSAASAAVASSSASSSSATPVPQEAGPLASCTVEALSAPQAETLPRTHALAVPCISPATSPEDASNDPARLIGSSFLIFGDPHAPTLKPTKYAYALSVVADFVYLLVWSITAPSSLNEGSLSLWGGMQIVLLSCLAADAVGLSAVLGGTVLVWLLDVHLCFVLVSALALLLLDPKAACTIAGLLFLGLRILVLVVGHRLRRQCLHPHFLARYRPIQH